jgi:hypothetical protein
MPITLLHFGVLAPINHSYPRMVSNTSFILVNLWADLSSILYAVFGVGDYSHDYTSHSFISLLTLALIVSVAKFRNASWVLGAILGAVTHVLLDSLVHSDIEPFYPLTGNMFYIGHMELVSLLLLPLFLWFILQSVSYTLGIFRK